MAQTITNITNPGQSPVDGNWVRFTDDDGSFIEQEFRGPPPDKTSEQLASEARDWRNAELQITDWIVPVTDHPERDAYMTYRTNLRNWPTTSDFPDTKPTL